MCADTLYKEFKPSSPAFLSPLTTNADRSYERKTAGSAGNCNDTDNNAADFVLNSTASNPQNLSSPPLACLVVKKVLATTPNGTYTTNDKINIKVTFSAKVNVTGRPKLRLETGETDRDAIYVSGSGSKSLIFRYTVKAGDTSNHLDYVSARALSLNGGSITGAIGKAVLILPKPGELHSLGANSAIIIDNGKPPSTLSFERRNPLSEHTKADTLVFRVTFSEGVTGVDTSDFALSSTTTAAITNVSAVSSSEYNVTVSGGNLAIFNGTVRLKFSNSLEIKDYAGKPLPATDPPVNEIYIVDNAPPTVKINQASGQADPANTQPVNFRVEFSEEIDAASFTGSDVTQQGTAPFVTWSITPSSDPRIFRLSAMARGNGTIEPLIAAGTVKDLAGNTNSEESTGNDRKVTLQDNQPPRINSINQAAGQVDPASLLPINFTVEFSEPILPELFTPSDITEIGTAAGITWSIANLGDNRTFTVSATKILGSGTVIPSIAANRVTDFVGNDNLASNRKGDWDDEVTYALGVVKTIVITEVAWAGTSASTTADEWIELFNNTPDTVSVYGWWIKAGDGYPSIELKCPNPQDCDIEPFSYFLIEYKDDDTVKGVNADFFTTWTSMSNSGETLLLCTPLNVANGECNINSKKKVADYVNGNGGCWPTFCSAPSNYGSMERKELNSDADTNWLYHTGDTPRYGHNRNWNGRDPNANRINGTPRHPNWAYRVNPTPPVAATPIRTATPLPKAGPILVLNEILPRPGTDWNNDGKVDVADEFIEVMNAGTVDVNLGAYKLDDYELNSSGQLVSNAFTLPSRTLKPGEKAVFYGSQTGILLDDSGDTVRLLRGSNNAVLDAVTYGVVKSLDSSICRYADGYGLWIFGCYPTPGLPNSLIGGGSPPVGGGGTAAACPLPDSTPEEFVQAECGESGLGIWNPSYWNSLPGEGTEIWRSEEDDKWAVIYE